MLDRVFTLTLPKVLAIEVVVSCFFSLIQKSNYDYMWAWGTTLSIGDYRGEQKASRIDGY